MSDRKRVCLHIGTHKTGTKVLQVFLAVNAHLLRACGIHVPQAGRAPVEGAGYTPGQHAIAWDFITGGTAAHFDSLLEEMVRSQAPLVVVSSEDFQHLYARPDALRAIADGFRSIGYVTTIVVYLREQSGYAESLYGEYVKHGYVPDFREFLDVILRDGAFTAGERTIAFDYEALLAPFAETFGAQNVTVRPYAEYGDPGAILRDFLRIIAALHGRLDVRHLKNPMPVANERLSLQALIEKMYEAARRHGDAGPGPQALLNRYVAAERSAMVLRGFRLLTHDDVVRFLDRFGGADERVNATAGIHIPFISLDDVPERSSAVWSEAIEQRALVRAAFEAWNLYGKFPLTASKY